MMSGLGLHWQMIFQDFAAGRIRAFEQAQRPRPLEHPFDPAAQPRSGFWRSLPDWQQGLQHDGRVDRLQRQITNDRENALQRAPPLLAMDGVLEAVDLGRFKELICSSRNVMVLRLATLAAA